MKKIQVTFPEGRVVDGVFTTPPKSLNGAPVLIADGAAYSGFQAIERGLFLSPINDPIIDPIIDLWLNTIRASA
jgi:hypothetical protein